MCAISPVDRAYMPVQLVSDCNVARGRRKVLLCAHTRKVAMFSERGGEMIEVSFELVIILVLAAVIIGMLLNKPHSRN